MEETQSSGAVTDETSKSEGAGNESSEGTDSANENADQATLQKINEAAGRDYKSLDDAVKGVAETYKFVGSQQKPKQEKPTPTKPSARSSNEESSKLDDVLAELETIKSQHAFDALKTYDANALEYLDEIKAYASTQNKTLVEAYKDSKFEKLVKASQAYEEERQKANPTMKPSGRVGVGPSDKLAKSAEKFTKSRDPATRNTAGNDIVAEFLKSQQR